MWPSSSSSPSSSRLPPEFFFVAAAPSFHHQDPTTTTTINLDPHNTNNPSVIPLFTVTPISNTNQNHDDIRTGMQLWQSQQHLLHHKPIINIDNNHNLVNIQSLGHNNNNNNNNNNNTGGGGGASSSSVGTTSCQDCGNQAKKDCPHRRCRTCCKSRGYDCTTHLKSTWVPAARRRERQLVVNGTAAAAGSSQSNNSGVKKPRLAASQTTTTASHTSTSNTTPPRSFDTTSSRQDASFKESLPGQVRAPAVFKCVKVTAVDDGEDEFAYQAVVRIGGHVFKGFLYDQGFEGREGFPNLSELHLGGGGGGRNGATSTPSGIDPSDMYAASGGGGLLGGSNYGNTIN